MTTRHKAWRALDATQMTSQEFLKADTRIHCLFIILSPHRFHELDKQCILKLAPLAPIIPIIAKADAMTATERNRYLEEVRSELDILGRRLGEACIHDFEGEDITSLVPLALTTIDGDTEFNSSADPTNGENWAQTAILKSIKGLISMEHDQGEEHPTSINDEGTDDEYECYEEEEPVLLGDEAGQAQKQGGGEVVSEEQEVPSPGGWNEEEPPISSGKDGSQQVGTSDLNPGNDIQIEPTDAFVIGVADTTPLPQLCVQPRAHASSAQGRKSARASSATATTTSSASAHAHFNHFNNRSDPSSANAAFEPFSRIKSRKPTQSYRRVERYMHPSSCYLRLPNIFATACCAASVANDRHRIFPWGNVDTLSVDHSDFIRLQSALFESPNRLKALMDQTRAKSIKLTSPTSPLRRSPMSQGSIHRSISRSHSIPSPPMHERALQTNYMRPQGQSSPSSDAWEASNGLSNSNSTFVNTSNVIRVDSPLQKDANAVSPSSTSAGSGNSQGILKSVVFGLFSVNKSKGKESAISPRVGMEKIYYS